MYWIFDDINKILIDEKSEKFRKIKTSKNYKRAFKALLF